jgi:cytoskeletal protein CcmA (bactofilin family)
MTRTARISLTAFAVLLPIIAYAATEQTATVSVGNERYVAGQNVTITDTAPGDLTVAAGTLTVNGTVQGSMQAVGGTVTISGDIRHNARIAAGTVEITHVVGGNLVVAGGTVHIDKEAVIGGSVLVYGGTVVIDGAVEGDVQVHGGSLMMNGTVGGKLIAASQSVSVKGNVLGDASVSAESVSFGQGARINGTLYYWQPSGQANYNAIAKKGLVYQESLAIKQYASAPATRLAAAIAAFTLVTLLMAALVIAVLLLITKNFFRDSARYVMKEPGMSFLVGLVYFVVTPIAAVILFITVVGIPLALAVGLLYGLSVFFSKLVASVVLAKWTEMYYRKKWTFAPLFFVSLGIYILLRVVGIIPILGFLAMLFAVMIAFGGLLRAKFDRYKKVM